MPSFNGDVVVRVPSYFLDCTAFESPSRCIWIPTGQRHEAVESCGYLWQTCLCQTGVFGSTFNHSCLIQIIYSGKHVFPSQLNSFGVIERLSHLLSAEPGELLLEESEAVRITTEAYRLWAVAAGYGQACKLYTSVNIYKLAARCTKIPKQAAYYLILKTKCSHHGSKACVRSEVVESSCFVQI